MRRILDKNITGLVWKGLFMVGATCRHHRGTLCLLVADTQESELKIPLLRQD
jgi:hypothetical protein